MPHKFDCNLTHSELIEKIFVVDNSAKRLGFWMVVIDGDRTVKQSRNDKITRV